MERGFLTVESRVPTTKMNQTFNPACVTFSVIDPANRTGKIPVPSHLVQETMGKQHYIAQHCMGHDLQTPPLDFSICMLFQSGQCRAGAWCRQIHADPSYVCALRQQAATGSTCCTKHGDPRSNEDWFKKIVARNATFTLLISPTESRVLPTSVLGRTIALEQVVINNQPHQATGTGPTRKVKIPARRVCRLHSESKCHFGRDCKNFHICREAYKNVMQHQKCPFQPSEEIYSFRFQREEEEEIPTEPELDSREEDSPVPAESVATVSSVQESSSSSPGPSSGSDTPPSPRERAGRSDLPLGPVDAVSLCEKLAKHKAATDSVPTIGL
eukprot:TRINITY_DN68353_c0_g1_i1.p1 TRINITY_DN68353_c0_g1~~TRINITY_DN68353_c0_g1_i1.p1  ORF type:complete len:328 (-),score=20.92 TRINITY_DN68353_c0_g1_i1:658-1641(-)